MSNKAQRVGQEAHTAQGEAECCMVPRDPTLSALITHTAHTVHAITNLLCFSSVKHKTVLYYKGTCSSAV